MIRPSCPLGLALLIAIAGPLPAQRVMEALDRGVVALRTETGRVHVSRRLLGTDPDAVAFNIYRTAGTGYATVTTKLNASPHAATTDFVDTSVDPEQPVSYQVRPVLATGELSSGGSFTLPAHPPVRPYLTITLTPHAGGTTPDGVAYTYTANDGSAADLDGDGDYELILKWDPTNAKDNSQSGHTGSVFLDAYTLEGVRLWRIDLGRNIRAGAHYTQFMAYDLDGDGRAEVACKTADGTVDGAGRVIGDGAADHRNSAGYVLRGPEFLTVFDGVSGRALATTGYLPARNSDPASSDVSAWGDNYGNRVDRFRRLARTADLHLSDSRDEPAPDVDARSTIPAGRGVAECRLQPAAASRFLPRRRHEPSTHPADTRGTSSRPAGQPVGSDNGGFR